MEKITIKTDFIKLDALLKYASMVSSGGEAKIAIADGNVIVNDEICRMRGKKIRDGDKVSFNGKKITVSNE